MPTMLEVADVGQIRHAKVRFGDLTVFVGPQATGKSILLQLFRLLVDTGAVLAEMKRYGLDWKRDGAQFLDAYLGEGMSAIWRRKSRLVFNGKSVDLGDLVGSQKKSKKESLFFVPAQRVLTLGRGWPRPFTDYSPGDPFAVRDFSEKIRVLMEAERWPSELLFPQSHRLKSLVRESLQTTVFRDFSLRVDKGGPQKRLMLHPSLAPQSSEEIGGLPFMVWSAGQREFVPLLLGFYWLLPPTKTSRRGDIQWVVIEEIEMGLHPRAISTVLLLVLDLLSRGYRVCLSTHSSHVLDVVWALKVFQRYKATPRELLELFHVEKRQDMARMAEAVLEKEARVYYFDPDKGRTQEISGLDPGSDNAAESGWGGLAGFSGHVADVVASVVCNGTNGEEER